MRIVVFVCRVPVDGEDSDGVSVTRIAALPLANDAPAFLDQRVAFVERDASHFAGKSRRFHAGSTPRASSLRSNTHLKVKRVYLSNRTISTKSPQ